MFFLKSTSSQNKSTNGMVGKKQELFDYSINHPPVCCLRSCKSTLDFKSVSVNKVKHFNLMTGVSKNAA